MSSLYFLLFISLLFQLSSTMKTKSQEIKSARLLDLVIRDYTFQSYGPNFRTGIMHNVHLPANLSGIGVKTVRFRCGSLRRYGAKVEEFRLGIGVILQPCLERVMIIRQNLGSNWSSIYYQNYDLSGYQLVSPILGLVAYNAGQPNYTNPFELTISPGQNPILVDFSNLTRVTNVSKIVPLCASFLPDGKVNLEKQLSPCVCMVKRQGHVGLVVESPAPPMKEKKKAMSQWKVIVGSSIGALLGVFLLGLLLVAMFVEVKKRSKLAEMEIRAYEEEALQVSMVGHVRAPTAPVTRTLPTLEHEYRPPPS
ncbi:Protein of unknown function DUF1191 [Dillenia turbinata]|uniref:Transmembrane protein n=1 Tax=Dillenia turbinata TaxID=194707 RepID=A0AAN8WJJ2_9MAGN